MEFEIRLANIFDQLSKKWVSHVALPNVIYITCFQQEELQQDIRTTEMQQWVPGEGRELLLVVIARQILGLNLLLSYQYGTRLHIIITRWLTPVASSWEVCCIRTGEQSKKENNCAYTHDPYTDITILIGN